MAYMNLLATVKTAEGQDWDWRPPRIDICSSRKTDASLIQNVGIGNLFNSETKQKIPEATLFFPVYASRANRWFNDEYKLVCSSDDGEKGTRIDKSDPHFGEIIDCGSADKCPNVPEQWQKSLAPCKWFKTLYVVDSGFNNIYEVNLKYGGVTETHDLMQKATKKGGMIFNPEGSNWFTLKTFEKGSATKVGLYHKAVGTDQPVSEDQAFALGQCRALVHLYREHIKNKRDTRGSQAQDDLASLEDATVEAEGTLLTSV